MTREDAIWWVNHLFEIRKEEYFNKGMLQDAREVDKARQIVIYALQTEVVRCKDCIHQEHCHETVAHTKRHDGCIEYWSETIEWCSRGEHKGGDDE